MGTNLQNGRKNKKLKVTKESKNRRRKWKGRGRFPGRGKIQWFYDKTLASHHKSQDKCGGRSKTKKRFSEKGDASYQ